MPPTVADPVNSTVFEGSDTASLYSDDPVEGTNGTESEPEEALPILPRNNRGFTEGLRHLDEFSLVEVFKRRAHIMRCVPHILRGFFAAAIRSACEEIVRAHEAVDLPRLERVWKLLLFLPRMLLTKPRRGGFVPKKELATRLALFSAGEWHTPMRRSVQM